MKMENCSQSENLVAYLYGEANDAEKKAFESHLSSCSLCSDELKAFGMVRESVVEWREDVLNNIVTPAFAKEIVTKQENRRSALTAIGEFFTLSPMWLRGATAFAVIALVALIAFAAVQLFDKKDEKAVANSNKNEVVTPSPEESPKKNESNQADVKIVKKDEPDKTTDESPNNEKNKTDVRKSEQVKNRTQLAENKKPRPVKKQTPLSDEEIVGYQMAYYDEDSLRLSSINP